MDLLAQDPEELKRALAAASDEIGSELRRFNDLKRALLMHVDGSTMLHLRSLAAPLLNERDADMLRGRIAELQKLKQLIQNGGNT